MLICHYSEWQSQGMPMTDHQNKEVEPHHLISNHAVERYCERILLTPPPKWERDAPQDYRAREMCRRSNVTVYDVKCFLGYNPIIRAAQKMGLREVTIHDCIARIAPETGVVMTIVPHGTPPRKKRKAKHRKHTRTKNKHQRRSEARTAWINED